MLKSWDAHQTRLVCLLTTIFWRYVDSWLMHLLFAEQWAAVRVLAQWSRKLCYTKVLILFRGAQPCLCVPFLFGTQLFSHLKVYDLISFQYVHNHWFSGSEPFIFCRLQCWFLPAVAITASKFGGLIQTGLIWTPSFESLYWRDLWVTVAFLHETVVLKELQIISWLVNSFPFMER